jgi:hypothetical protein
MQLKQSSRAVSLALVLSTATLLGGSVATLAQAPTPNPTPNPAQGNDASSARINAIPLDQLVTATCRQAWHMGGSNQDGFFDIVERLTQLSAHNRGVTLPDDKNAGSRAGNWIRTQAIKDPDQLLYAVVDHAVLYSMHKGSSTPVSGTSGTSGK